MNSKRIRSAIILAVLALALIIYVFKTDDSSSKQSDAISSEVQEEMEDVNHE